MLNFPKTGSSFARRAIKQVYTNRNSTLRNTLEKMHLCPPSVREVIVPKIDEKIGYNIKDQHGTLRQIPEAYKNNAIVSITRNPISRYQSTYHFKWWQQYPPDGINVIREKYPYFPNISFSEYYEMLHVFGRKNRLQGIVPKIDLGLHSIQFIQFYFHNPQDVLRKIDNEYIEKKYFLEDMGIVKFLHQENLNQEIKSFLVGVGIEREQVRIIDAMKKVNVTEIETVNSKPMGIENEIQDLILKRDKLLFEIFPKYLPS